MYIVIKQNPLNIKTFEAKLDLANYLGVHRHTVTQRFKDVEFWEHDKGTVYQANVHKPRLRGGNKDSLIIKRAKADGDYTEE